MDRPLAKTVSLAACALALGMAGCGGPDRITRDDVKPIAIGMSRDDVEDKLGEPEKSVATPDVNCLTYISKDQRKREPRKHKLPLLAQKKREADRRQAEREEKEGGKPYPDSARWQFCFEPKTKKLRSIARDGVLVR